MTDNKILESANAQRFILELGKKIGEYRSLTFEYEAVRGDILKVVFMDGLYITIPINDTIVVDTDDGIIEFIADEVNKIKLSQMARILPKG